MTHRGETSLVIYGRRAVLELIVADNADVEIVRVARSIPKDVRREIAVACKEKGVMVEETDIRTVGSLSGDPRHDQGVAARAVLRNVTEVEDFIEQHKGAAARNAVRILALDGITNPQNIGMIVRSAVAFGLSAMLWPTVGSPWISGLIVKSSAATLFHCPIVRCHALEEALWALQGAGFKVAALDASAKTNLEDWKPPHRCVAVVGRETTGVSQEVLDTADERIAIPIAPAAESLNAAVAASILCHHLSRASH